MVEQQMSVLPHSVLEDASNPSSIAINMDQAANLSNKAVASIVRADVINVNPSDSCNSSIITGVRRHPNDGEDRRSLSGLQRNTSSRRGSQASLFPLSPRPGSRSSRGSTRRSSRRKGSDEKMTRGEILMDLSRRDSIRSRESRRSFRDQLSSSRRRKEATSSISRSDSSTSRLSETGVAFTTNGRRNYMTAQEAVLLGEKVCGCMLKSRMMYFLKPAILLTLGIILIIGGIALTVLHFMYEDVVGELGEPSPSTNVPYFTWGPITLSTGVIVFIVALVWFPIKEQKWKDGTASPMVIALKIWHEENERKESMEMRRISTLESPVDSEKVIETRLDMEQVAGMAGYSTPPDDNPPVLQDRYNV